VATRFVLPFADVGAGIRPASGAQLFFTDTGTSTDRDTFSDEGATTPNTNPVIADSNGLFSDIFIDGTYRVILRDSDGVQIFEADPVRSNLIGAPVGVFNDVAAMVAADLSAGNYVTTNAYFGTFSINLDTPLGGANYSIMTLAHFVNATVGLTTPDNVVDHLLANGLVAMMDRQEGIHVTQGGVIGTAGNPSNGTDESARLQGVLDALRTGDVLSLNGIETIFTSQPLYLMSDTNWPAGFTADVVANIEIDMGRCRIKYNNSVEFSAIYQDVPIHNQVQTLATTTNRTPAMFQVSISGLNLHSGFFDGNMVARAAVVGNPVGISDEACIHLIACKFPIVTDIVCNDSMGDGIKLGDPFTAGAVVGSAFRGANSLDGLTEDGFLSNIQAINNAGSTVNVISADRCSINDINADNLNNTANFIAAVEAPAVKFESDLARSFFNSLGFSRVTQHSVKSVFARACPTGGALVIQNSRDVHITDIVIKQGSDDFGIGRIVGQLGVDGSKFCSASGISYCQIGEDNVQHNSVSLLEVSGDSNVFQDIKIVPQVNNGVITHNSFESIFIVDDVSARCIIKNVSGFIRTSVNTGFFIDFQGGNQVNFLLADIDVEFISASVGISTFVRAGANNDIRFDNLKIAAPDTLDMFTNSDGVFDLTSSGNELTVTNCIFDFRGFSLVGSSTSVEANTVYFKNILCRGMVMFPTPIAFDHMTFDGVTVQSMFNLGGGNESAMLGLFCEASQVIKIMNCEVNSNGRFGFNQATEGVIITTSGSFNDLGTFQCEMLNNRFFGGRAADDLVRSEAFENGGGTASFRPWNNSVISAKFISQGNVINGSNRLDINPIALASLFQVDLAASLSRFTMLPGSKVDVVLGTSVGLNNAMFITQFGTGGQNLGGDLININFVSNILNPRLSISLL